MRDFFEFFSVLIMGLSAIFVVIGIIIGIVCLCEYATCPKIANMYDTEHKFVMGTCYLKYDNKWLTASKYNQVVMVNALNVKDESKLLLMKNIDK